MPGRCLQFSEHQVISLPAYYCSHWSIGIHNVGVSRSLGKRRLLALFIPLVYYLLNTVSPVVVASVHETPGSMGCTFLQPANLLPATVCFEAQSYVAAWDAMKARMVNRSAMWSVSEWIQDV